MVIEDTILPLLIVTNIRLENLFYNLVVQRKKSRSNMKDRRKNTRRKNTRRKNTRRRNTRRKNTRKQVLPVVGTLYYFTMEGCPYCKRV